MRAAGLLLLRTAVALPLVHATAGAPGWLAVLLWADAALLASGLLTPAAAFAAAAHAWFPCSPPISAGLQAILPALSLMLTGAGRLSLDAWIFGPRLVMAWPEPER
jgi:hypothetical protein